MLEHYEIQEMKRNINIGGCYDETIYEVVDYDNNKELLMEDIKKYNENCAFWLSLSLGNIINDKQTVILTKDHLD